MLFVWLKQRCPAQKSWAGHSYIAANARQFSIDNIQQIVAEYYHISLRELNGKKLNRGIARPRRIAMALSRELTQNSYPEIGQAFDGRDHSTVIHACERVRELCAEEPDYQPLLRLVQA